MASKRDNRHAERNARALKVKSTSSACHLQDLIAICNDLKDEIKYEQTVVLELEEKQEEYENVIDHMNDEYGSNINEYKGIINSMDHYYENELEKLSPNYVKKHWDDNMTRDDCGFMFLSVSPCHYHSYISFYLLKINTGAHAEWMPHEDELILEMLSNHTPPTCIQTNIYTMSHLLLPNHNVVIELPSLKQSRIYGLCCV